MFSILITVFVLPIIGIHRRMEKYKQDKILPSMEQFRNERDNIEAKLVDQPTDVDLIEKKRILTQLLYDREKMPVWPLNLRILAILFIGWILAGVVKFVS